MAIFEIASPLWARNDCVGLLRRLWLLIMTGLSIYS
jgi:hypothetical protein